MNKYKNFFIIFLIGGLVSAGATVYIYKITSNLATPIDDCQYLEQQICADTQFFNTVIPVMPVAVSASWTALLLCLSSIFFYAYKKSEAGSK